MPIAFERDDARRRIILTGTGAVTGNELMAVMDRQAAEGIWQYCVLYDSSQITEPPSPHDLRRVAEHAVSTASRHGRRGCVAMFAPTDVIYGTARIYESVVDDTVTWRVFRTRSDAEAWLTSQTAGNGESG